jgi:hypothetical protein
MRALTPQRRAVKRESMSKRVRALQTNPIVREVMKRGEERLSKLATQVLASERFVGLLQATVRGTLGARRVLDNNLRVALSALNLPSTSDMRAINDRLDDLERLLNDVDERLQRLADPASIADESETRA